MSKYSKLMVESIEERIRLLRNTFEEVDRLRLIHDIEENWRKLDKLCRRYCKSVFDIKKGKVLSGRVSE